MRISLEKNVKIHLLIDFTKHFIETVSGITLKPNHLGTTIVVLFK